MQRSQPLLEDGIVRNYAFARKPRALQEDNTDTLNVIWYSNKAHFHLDGCINKQNVQLWASENPRLTTANSLHPDRATVWCALSSVRIFSPMFTNGTVNFDIYFSLLNYEFVPFLIEYSTPINSAWFQQDGAKPHISNTVLCFLHDVFEERVLLHQNPVLFAEGFTQPLTSPHLNSHDYFLWGYLKNSGFQKNPHSMHNKLPKCVAQSVNFQSFT
jgi:hypothetical protein